MIYLDNAATTLQKPSCVGKAMMKAMEQAGNAARGVNTASLAASRILETAREELADFFGFSDPHRVCFTQNGTESLNTAIFGLFSRGDHVVTTAMEHNAVLRPLRRLEEEGEISLTILPADKCGRFSLKDLKAAIKKETKAVILQHASNVTGNVCDLYKVGEICRREQVYLVVDAAQTAGMFPIHMEQMHIDVFCFTGHKGMLGPQGTGGILVGKDVDIRPLKEGGTGIHSFDRRQPAVYPEHLEAGTMNLPGIAGLLEAVRYIRRQGQENLAIQEIMAAKTFYQYVKQIPHIRLYGDYTSWEGDFVKFPPERMGIVSLNIEGYSSGEVADELMERFDIATRSGVHCAPLAHETLQTAEQGMVRFSFSPFTTVEEAVAAGEAVERLACE